MDPGIESTLKQVVPLAIAAVAMPLIARKRGFSLQDDLRLVRPSMRNAALWIGIWVVWITVTELARSAMGEAPPERWNLPLPLVAMRVVGIVALAPFVEEFLFRGLLFRILGKTPIGPGGAIVVLAIAFAAIHFQYTINDRLFIVLDALLFGLARWRGDSLALPILMHAIGNSVAAAQRLPL